MDTHLTLLTAIDGSPMGNEDINSLATILLRRMIDEIKMCASTRRDSDLVFILPQSTLIFPKHYLKEHIETKWERFARTKGIKKKKRSALVYDEEIGDYVPRYGAYSKKNRMLNAAVKDGEVTSSSLRREKRKNVEKNRASMLANRLKNG